MADLIALSDIISPNETEAAEITGIEPTDLASAEAAGRKLWSAARRSSSSSLEAVARC